MKKFVVIFLLYFVSFGLKAEWKLVNDNSIINFISVKKSKIGEVHHFKSLSGSLKDGQALVNIDLSSVDTNIEIRNERLKKFLFEVSKFPNATIAAAIDTKSLEALKIGDSFKKDIVVKVSLHGITIEVQSLIRVIKLSDGSILVYSENPVVVNAVDFEMESGIQMLQKIAKLPVISSAVPITFSLRFQQQENEL